MPQDREPPDNSHSRPASSSVLSGFTQPEAVVIASAEVASSSQPPVTHMQPKSQENDIASYIFRDYSGSQLDPMGLPPPGFGQQAPMINGDPEGNDGLTGTVDDALELFPALRGCSQPLQEELIGESVVSHPVVKELLCKPV